MGGKEKEGCSVRVGNSLALNHHPQATADDAILVAPEEGGREGEAEVGAEGRVWDGKGAARRWRTS